MQMRFYNADRDNYYSINYLGGEIEWLSNKAQLGTELPDGLVFELLDAYFNAQECRKLSSDIKP